jgi:hypothetical protein
MKCSKIATMHVEHGMRFELRLDAETPESTRYQLELRVPDAVWNGEAEIVGPGGEVKLVFSEFSVPPEWCLSIVRASLRTLVRERPTRGSYPSRVARWRPRPQVTGGESS